MKVEIGNVKIKIDKKTVTLSLKQTELLFQELNKIFGPRYNYNTITYPWTLTNGSNTGTITTTDSVPVTFSSTGTEINLTQQGE